MISKIFTQDDIDFFLTAKVEKISDENINKLNEVLEYYNKYLPKTKKGEIIKLGEIIKKRVGNYEKYLNDYEIAEQKNLRYPLIEILIEPKNENKKITEEEIILAVNKWNTYEDMINKNFLNKIPKTAKNKIFDYFKNEANKEHLLKIFKEDVYERFKTHKDKKDKKEIKKIKEIKE